MPWAGPSSFSGKVLVRAGPLQVLSTRWTKTQPHPRAAPEQQPWDHPAHGDQVSPRSSSSQGWEKHQQGFAHEQTTLFFLPFPTSSSSASA